MRSKLVRAQLVAFLIITVLGITYTGVHYVGLDRYFGAAGTTVQMQLQNSGGIFENAEVTYRGVSVGKVGALSLTSTGVAVDLILNDSAPNIPMDLKAVVANRSAVGEQYVDLRPNTDKGPFLKAGSVIPADRTAIPVATQDLLASVDGLARSVPLTSLQTVVRELGAAFRGTGPALQTLLDQGNLLTQAAIDALPQTLKLIADSQTVLNTQRKEGSAIISFSADLKLISEQLQTSDPDIRRLIGTGQQAGAQLGALLDTTAAPLSTTVANLLTLADVSAPRINGIKTINQTLPLISAASFTVVPGDGFAHFGLVQNVNDPFPCTAGYESTYAILAKQKAANPNFNDRTDPSPLNTNAYCAEPFGSPISVRGSQHATLRGAGGGGQPGGGQPSGAMPPAAQPGGPGFNAPPQSQANNPAGNALQGVLNQLLPLAVR